MCINVYLFFDKYNFWQILALWIGWAKFFIARHLWFRGPFALKIMKIEIPEFCGCGNHGDVTGTNNRVDPQTFAINSMRNVSKTTSKNLTAMIYDLLRCRQIWQPMAGIAWPGGLDAMISFTRDIWKFKVSQIRLYSRALPVSNSKINIFDMSFGW